MSKYDVLCIGSATIDAFLSIDQRFSSLHMGDKILVTSLEKHTGGGATNSAAALSELGLKVKTLTKLSHDHDADFIRKELKRYGVENLCRNTSRQMTDSATIITSSKEKDRIVFVHKGASTGLSAADFSESDFDCGWIYLASLTGDSFKAVSKIIAIAKKRNIPLLFNPSLYLAQKGKTILAPVLKQVTILVLNKEEAQAVLKVSSSDLIILARKLHALGPAAVVVTDGKKGLAAFHNGISYTAASVPSVKVADTTGAGDALTSGLLFAVMKHYPFEDALRLGMANASSVIQHLGAKNKLLSEKEALNFIRKNIITIHKKRI
ncbi:MAG: carbohydrate kinase family protein [Nanoarchaeota archaeon]